MEQYKKYSAALITYTENLETQVKTLNEALYNLLNEDDVKELPSYILIEKTYREYLKVKAKPENHKKSATSHDASDASTATTTTHANPRSADYDPLHAPPGARGYKKSFKKDQDLNMESSTSLSVESHAVEKPETVNHYSSQMPDINVCMLSEEAPKKQKVELKIKPKSSSVVLSEREKTSASIEKAPEIKPVKRVQEIKPEKSERVYKVEINGIVYLRHKDVIFDSVTKAKLGHLTKRSFIIDKKAIEIGVHSAPVSLYTIPDFPQYYSTGQGCGVIYITINDNIAQAVGEYNEGELELWA